MGDGSSWNRTRCWNTLTMLALGLIVALVTSGCSEDGGRTTPPSPSSSPAASTSSSAAAQPGQVCGKTRPGPASVPNGAVTVDPAKAGDLSAKAESSAAGSTFWLAPGTHRLPPEEFAQVEPKNGDTFLGAPGAVLDGAGVNRYAFTGKASDVTIKGLTIKNFVSPVNEGVVNHDSGAGWVIQDTTMVGNDGAAMMSGTRQVMTGNCFKDNGQYGLNACCGALTDLILNRNEFVGNNADDVEKTNPGCGCSGGMKLWEVNGADIRNNWIHGNHGPGIWADTNNNDFLIEHNMIEGNDGAAIFYETSYNAIIRDNVIRGNNMVEGREFADRGDNFPAAAIYLSESGGDAAVPARTDRIEIYRNDFSNNWSGITLWENADRFCNSPANSSTGICTLKVKQVSQCSAPAIDKQPLLGNCRWKTQRVSIHHNRFEVDPEALDCDTLCARMAVLSNYGTVPEWSPYMATVVQEAITFRQDNHWFGNTYVGPWRFMAFDTNRTLNPRQWQGPDYKQDQGSRFDDDAGSSAPATAEVAKT
jgi:hypothetical protein